MKKVIWILLVTLVIGSLVLGGCSSGNTTKSNQTQVAAKDLEIGGIFALSGPASEAFSRMYDGAKIVVSWINDNGGITINGQKYNIKLDAEDMKMTPDGMTAAVKKLVFDNKVKYIVSACPVPPLDMIGRDIADANKVIWMKIDGLGVDAEYTAQKPYTFGIMTSRSTYGIVLKKFKELYPNVKTFTVMAPEDASMVEDAKHLADAAIAAGFVQKDTVSYPMGTADFYPMWTKILSNQPDCIAASAGIPEWTGSFVKQGRELGYKGPFCFPMLGCDPVTMSGVAGSQYSTDILAASYSFASPDMTPKVKEIGQIMKAKAGVDLNYDNYGAFQAIWALVQGIQNAQSLDPTVLKDKFDTMTNIDTPTGTGWWSGQQTYGIKHILLQKTPMVTIMNGVVKHKEWFSPESP